MERYKSIVKAVTVSGARHAFLLNDGQTWLSVFLRRDQKPEFQQAVRNVAHGQEYIFDCLRNERNFLNITAIQHPSWPAPIPMRDVQAGAPSPPMSSQPMVGSPPMPGATAVSPSAPQPASIYAPLPTVNLPPPSPILQPQPESPALAVPAPPVESVKEDAEEITEIREPRISVPSSSLLKEQLIARENAATNAAAIICAIIEKNSLPEDMESFIVWVGVKFVQLQDIIASNTLRTKDSDLIPF